ncbi:hypothetical protein [Salinibacterium sp. ZJ450]|nr:hypothetical protein [Salinibacterium sp. ZJ450]
MPDRRVWGDHLSVHVVGSRLEVCIEAGREVGAASRDDQRVDHRW